MESGEKRGCFKNTCIRVRADHQYMKGKKEMSDWGLESRPGLTLSTHACRFNSDIHMRELIVPNFITDALRRCFSGVKW